VAAGRAFLGRAVTAGPVLYLALEDSLQRLRERTRKLQVEESAPVEFYTEWARLDEIGGLRELLECVAEMRPRLVVIDTLSRALGRGQANQGEMVGAVMASLQQLARGRNCCVLTIDHHRKQRQGRDVVSDLLGPTSKAAVLDTVWGLYDGGEQGGAILSIMGREVAPCELALEFDAGSGTWQVRPEAEVAPKESAVTEVARALAELGGAATTSEIASALGMPVGNVSRALGRLVRDGRVRKGERERHRVPYLLVG
jgi:DNA-binding transcriptional ArsR family regulator